MNAILIGGGIAAVVILGAWLRWAMVPVRTAYRLGEETGTMLGARFDGAEPSPWRRRAAQAMAAWLAPWRAARKIRSQKRDMTLLIRTAGDVIRERNEAWELLDAQEPAHLAASSK